MTDDRRQPTKTIASLPIESMGRDELLALKEQNARDMHDVQSQLDNAFARSRETGVRIDDDWLRRARSALRFKGIITMRIDRRLAVVGAEQRAANRVAHTQRITDEHQMFLHAVYQALKETMPEAFVVLTEKARRRVALSDENPIMCGKCGPIAPKDPP